jgi:tight adherence protein B
MTDLPGDTFLFWAAALCSAGFLTVSALLARQWWRRRSGILAADLGKRLQRRGMALYGLHVSQGQLARAGSAAHIAAIALVLFLGWTFGAPWLMLLTALVLLWLAPGLLAKWRTAIRLDTMEAELPDALLFLAGALRAGSALPVALGVYVRENKGPLTEEFAKLIAGQRIGVSFEVALMEMAERVKLPDFTLVTVALRVSREVGGNLSEPLSLLADTLRKKSIMEGRIRSLTSQGKAQAIVMTLLPVALGLVLYQIQPSTALLVTTDIGLLVVGIAVIMLMLGYWMIKKIVTIDV